MFGMNWRAQTHHSGWLGAACAIALAVCMLLAACTSGGATSGNTTNGKGGSTNGAPTATSQPKPTTLPVIDLAFCQKALSIAQANQILSPVNPANTIVPTNTSTGGSCNYDYATDRIDVFLFFEPYTGGSLTTIATDAANKSLPGATLTTDQSVSGLGDQALFLAGHGTTTQDGVTITAKESVLYVVDGGVGFTVNNDTYNSPFTGTIDSLGSSSDATIESEFEQIAQMVMAAL